MKQFNEAIRKEYDLRYSLIVNIQNCIALVQSELLIQYERKSDSKVSEDFIKLSRLQAQLPEYSIQTLRKIYHDISLKVGALANEK